MASVSEVKRWNAAALNEIATTMQQREQVLINSGDDFGKILPVDGWTGGAAADAASAHRLLHFRLDKMATGASVVHKALMQASDAIPAVQREVQAAEDLAEKYGFRVGDAGQVDDMLLGKTVPADLNAEDRVRAQQQIADDVAQALRTANSIDDSLTAVLHRAAQGEYGSGEDATVAAAAAAGNTDPGLALPGPPPNASPSQNAAWWASLSAGGQNLLLHDHPDWLGNLDGLPSTVRSQANMARLPGERAALQHQLADLERTLPQGVDPDNPVLPMGYPYDGDWKAIHQIGAIKEKLKSLDAVAGTIAQGDRQLLTLDTSGLRVKAAVAVGNVDTAKHVAVFTPGFTSTVDGSLKGYDESMRDMQARSDRMSHDYGDHGKVATVTWIGYDAPQIGEVADPSQSVAADNAAKAGAQKLDGFLNGIGASHDQGGQPLHLTALGHSYGSLTTGIALQHHTPVQDAVVFGSPGMDIHSASDLQVPTGHVYSEMGDQDFVPDADIAHHFGTSPYDIPDIHRLSTDAATGIDGKPLVSVHGHSEYLTNNSTSQYNMASIVAGRPDLAIGYQPHGAPPGPAPTPPPPSTTQPPPS
ncbi:alpha/beta hydrolase [Amycolatopsis nivea]